jgi:hypothetical protein
MSGPKLLREWFKLEYKPALIKEALSGGQAAKLRGIFQREVNNYSKAVRERRAVGELDHPESSTVSLKNVSHVVINIDWDGDDVVGELEVLPTAMGKELAALLSAGVTVGISSRGVGSTKKGRDEQGDFDEVSEDFQLICFDVVSEPSTQGAYLHEGKEVNFDPRRTWTKADRIFRALNEITRK